MRLDMEMFAAYNSCKLCARVTLCVRLLLAYDVTLGRFSLCFTGKCLSTGDRFPIRLTLVASYARGYSCNTLLVTIQNSHTLDQLDKEWGWQHWRPIQLRRQRHKPMGECE